MQAYPRRRRTQIASKIDEKNDDPGDFISIVIFFLFIKI